MATNNAQIQQNIAKICLKLDSFLSDISDITDAVESYRGMENIDNKKCIEDYEKSSIPLFTENKNQLYSQIRSLLRSIS